MSSDPFEQDLQQWFPEETDIVKVDWTAFKPLESSTAEQKCEFFCRIAEWWSQERLTELCQDRLAIETILAQAFKISPVCQRALVVKGRLLRELAESSQGEDAEATRLEAIRALQKACSNDPGDEKAWCELGLAFYGADRSFLTQAEDSFRQALTLLPEDVCARLYLGHCLHDQSRWEEALCAYTQTLFSESRSELGLWRVVKLREQLGYCCLKLGLRKAAIELFRDTLAVYQPLKDDLEFYDSGLVCPDELVDASTGELADELAAEVMAMITRLGWSKMYQKYSVRMSSAPSSPAV